MAVDETLRKLLFVKWTFILLLFPVQRMSLYHFGDLHSYPYHYMPTSAASIPALPTCSSSSPAVRNPRLCPQPCLRFSPYLIPTSIHLKPKPLSASLLASSSSFSDASKSASKHLGLASGNASSGLTHQASSMLPPHIICKAYKIWWGGLIKHFLISSFSYHRCAAFVCCFCWNRFAQHIKMHIFLVHFWVLKIMESNFPGKKMYIHYIYSLKNSFKSTVPSLNCKTGSQILFLQ